MILLLHSVSGSYLAALRRARRIQRGAEILHPTQRFDRVLGRTPDGDPNRAARLEVMADSGPRARCLQAPAAAFDVRPSIVVGLTPPQRIVIIWNAGSVAG